MTGGKINATAQIDVAHPCTTRVSIVFVAPAAAADLSKEATFVGKAGEENGLD
jgi:hypothetical protein